MTQKKQGLPTWAKILIVLFVVFPIGCVGLGIVAAVAIPSLMSARYESQAVVVESDLQTLESILQEYADATGDYPRSMDDIGFEETPIYPWGRPYRYEPPRAPGDLPSVFTLGMDGLEGGQGPNQDLFAGAPPSSRD